MPGIEPLPEATRTLEAFADDGHRFEIQVFDAGVPETAPLVLVWPAMGTRGRNYLRLAERLRAFGVAAAVADLRGHGSSSMRARDASFGYADMLLGDWQAATTLCRRLHPNRPLFLAGHSLGGQLSLLFTAAHGEQIQGCILIAACSVYYRCYGVRALALRAAFPVIRLVTRLLGYFPGDRLGFAKQESAGVMRDWCRQGRTGRYAPNGDLTDYEAALARSTRPVLALEITGDRYAPPAAVTHLLDKLRSAAVQRRTLTASEARKGFEHFDWFKQPEEVALTMQTWLSGLNIGACTQT